MTLEFLTAAGPGAPPARGPLADAAAAAGATFEERDGWSVPVGFGDPAAEAAAAAETVAFADRSQLTKLEVQGAPDAVAAALPGLDEEKDRPRVTDSSPGVLATLVEGAWHCPVRPGVALVLCEPAAGPQRRAALEGGAGVRVCDLTTAWGALTVAGPRARDLFARFCALDLRESVLPVGGWRPGSVARTPGYVLREDDDRFLMLFGAAHGAYVWEVVADAAAHLGGRPVGQAALTAREEAARA